jgi:hypothetical protein
MALTVISKVALEESSEMMEAKRQEQLFEKRLPGFAEAAVAIWKSRVNRGWVPVDASRHTCRGRLRATQQKEDETVIHEDGTKRRDDPFADQRVREYKQAAAGTLPAEDVDAVSSSPEVRQHAKRSRKEAHHPWYGGACDMEKLEVGIFEPKLGAATSPSPHVQNPEGFHVCLKRWCVLRESRPDLHERAYAYLGNLYVCRATGLYHLCGAVCDRMAEQAAIAAVSPGSYGNLVCPVSGVSCADRETVDPMWSRFHNAGGTGYSSSASQASAKRGMKNPLQELGERYAQKRLRDNRSADTLFLAEDGRAVSELCLTGGRFQAPRGSKRSASSSSWGVDLETTTPQGKRGWLLLFQKKLHNMFSEDRFESELRKNEEPLREIAKGMDRYMQRAPSQGPGFLSARDLDIIAAEERNKRPHYPVVVLDPQLRNYMVSHYAHMCLKLWVILVTRTSKGKAFPERFPLDSFVEPAMLLFQKGFKVTGADVETPVVVIPEDEFLERVPVNTPTCSSFLRCGSDVAAAEQAGLRTRRRGSNNSTGTIRKNIGSALYHAVRDREVSPMELRPDLLEFDSIDDSVFERARRGGRPTPPPPPSSPSSPSSFGELREYSSLPSLPMGSPDMRSSSYHQHPVLRSPLFLLS